MAGGQQKLFTILSYLRMQKMYPEPELAIFDAIAPKRTSWILLTIDSTNKMSIFGDLKWVNLFFRLLQNAIRVMESRY